MPRRGWTLPFLAAALLGATVVVGPTASADPATPGVRLVSQYPDGTPARGDLRSITPDGRWILGNGAFTGAPTAHYRDVFLADGFTGATTSVTADPAGDRQDFPDAIGTSADGSTVVWDVDRGGTPTGDLPREVYVTDRRAGHTRHALTLPADVGANRWLSRDGKVLFFMQYRSGDYQVPWNYFTADLTTGEVRRVDARPDGSAAGAAWAVFAADGTAVVFLTTDPVLWPGLGSSEVGLVRRNLPSGTLERLSIERPGTVVLGASADARAIVLLRGGVYEWSDGTAQRIDLDEAGAPVGAWQDIRVSDDGRYVTFLGGNDRRAYRRDVQAGTTALVSIDPEGNVISGIDRFDASDDGSTVAFADEGPSTGRLVVRRVDDGTSVALCCDGGPDGFVSSVVLDGDGHRAAFEKWIKEGDTYTAIRVFRWDDPDVPIPPVLPEVSVTDAHVAEGAGQPMTWTVSLDRAATEPVTVRWWTAQDTSAPSERRAAPDKDFKPAAGSVTFAPGETTKVVSALVFDDSFVERDEWFVVELFDPTGATVGRGKATGTINDDESAALWSVPRQLPRLLPA